MKNSPQIFNHCEILSRKLFVFSWCNCTPAAPGDYSQLIFSAAESSLVHIVVSHLKKKAFTTREVCSKRKAKPATNPDVHQTRQDCNCVLAIPMQVVKKEAENVLKKLSSQFCISLSHFLHFRKQSSSFMTWKVTFFDTTAFLKLGQSRGRR